MNRPDHLKSVDDLESLVRSRHDVAPSWNIVDFRIQSERGVSTYDVRFMRHTPSPCKPSFEETPLGTRVYEPTLLDDELICRGTL